MWVWMRISFSRACWHRRIIRFRRSYETYDPRHWGIVWAVSWSPNFTIYLILFPILLLVSSVLVTARKGMGNEEGMREEVVR